MWAIALGMLAYIVLGIRTHQILENVIVGLFVIGVSVHIPSDFGKKRDGDESK